MKPERTAARSDLLRDRIAWIEGFAGASFDRIVAAGVDDYPARLKLSHSLLVLAEAEHILEREPWAASLPEDEREAIRLAALFHDVGRFPQYETYGTFDDRTSIDHGRAGMDALLGTDALGPVADRRLASLVRGAVLLHNRRLVPARLESRLARAVRVVRDADKLDIFRVMMAAFRQEGPINKVVALGLTEKPGARSPAIVEAVRGRRLARYEDMAWVDDFKMLLMSWAYDLTYPTSAQRLLEKGCVRELAAMLPDDELTRELSAQVHADLERAASGGCATKA